jgi:acetolactate synthase-1/2/3 large subunit
VRRRALRRPHHRPLDAFSPNSKKIHIDIDPSSINKNVRVDDADRRRCAAMCWKTWCVCGARTAKADKKALNPTGGSRSPSGGAQLAAYTPNNDVIMPQYAIERLYELTKDKRHLHHHRSRPAPDVGGAVLRLRGSRTAG